MARPKKSHISGEEKIKKKEEAPQYPFVIYCSYHRDGEKYPRSLVLKFQTPEEARNMVDRVIGNDTWEWKLWLDKDVGILTSSGITVRASDDQMKVILLEISPRAIKSDIKEVLQFKYGKSEYSEDLPPSEDGEAPGASDQRPREKVVREKKPKVDKSGMVSAGDIAKNLKVEPREVRGVLRSLKLEKPPGGWIWSKDQAKDIQEKVHAGLKEAKTKKLG